jgi:DNA-binding NarL/FixJ family response regulator
MEQIVKLGNGRVFIRDTGAEITESDVEIIKGYSEGLTPASISKRVFRSPRTIEGRTGRLRDKLGAKTTPQMVSIAKDLKLI